MTLHFQSVVSNFSACSAFFTRSLLHSHPVFYWLVCEHFGTTIQFTNNSSQSVCMLYVLRQTTFSAQDTARTYENINVYWYDSDVHLGPPKSSLMTWLGTLNDEALCSIHWCSWVWTHPSFSGFWSERLQMAHCQRACPDLFDSTFICRPWFISAGTFFEYFMIPDSNTS